MVFTLSQTLKLALNAQCEDDQACIDAVAAQLEPCLENNKDIDALVKAGGADDELTNQVVQDLTACIVDENGEPYFRGSTGYDDDVFEEEYSQGEPLTPPPASSTTIPR